MRCPVWMPGPDRVNVRNGYRHRDFDTRAGTLDVAITGVTGSWPPSVMRLQARRARIRSWSHHWPCGHDASAGSQLGFECRRAEAESPQLEAGRPSHRALQPTETNDRRPVR